MRIMIRIGLIITFLSSIIISSFSIKAIADGESQAWSALAAALAVLISVISTWNSQRISEIEEDKIKPYPYIYFDASSRYGLVLLKITNFGNSPACKISIKWTDPVTNHEGNIIKFSPDIKEYDILLLMPGQYLSATVDGTVGFFGRNRKHQYSGTIKYNDIKGKTYQYEFTVDAEMLKKTPMYDQEDVKTHYELQKIPKILEDIKKEISKFNNARI